MVCGGSNRAPFHFRRNIVVPNVYWGFGLDYEADLLVVSKAGYTTEVEIKVNKNDLLKDPMKKKFRKGLPTKISFFYYAVPEYLVELAMETFDERFGIIGITKRLGYEVSFHRDSPRLHGSRALSEEEKNTLLRLGVMRYWKRLGNT